MIEHNADSARALAFTWSSIITEFRWKPGVACECAQCWAPHTDRGNRVAWSPRPRRVCRDADHPFTSVFSLIGCWISAADLDCVGWVLRLAGHCCWGAGGLCSV